MVLVENNTGFKLQSGVWSNPSSMTSYLYDLHMLSYKLTLMALKLWNLQLSPTFQALKEE